MLAPPHASAWSSISLSAMRSAALLALLPCCAGYVLPHAPSRGPAVESLVRVAHGRVRAQSTAPTSEATKVAAEPEELIMVKPPTCVSCETEWIQKSKVTEGDERIRLDQVRGEDLTGYINEVWEYGMRMNDTQRQELALNPDTELRNFIISSSTAPTPLLEHVYNSTMQRVPYEQACYICGPEQAMPLALALTLTLPLPLTPTPTPTPTLTRRATSAARSKRCCCARSSPSRSPGSASTSAASAGTPRPPSSRLCPSPSPSPSPSPDPNPSPSPSPDPNPNPNQVHLGRHPRGSAQVRLAHLHRHRARVDHPRQRPAEGKG